MNGAKIELDSRIARRRGFTLVRLHPSMIEKEWDTIETLLNLGSEYWDKHYSLDGIRTYLLDGTLHFWYAIEEGEVEPVVGAITVIDQYEVRRTLRILWMGGRKGNDVVRFGTTFMWAIEAWARGLQCQSVEILGRWAFKRLLEPMGYDMTHVVMSKELQSTEVFDE